MNDVLGQARRTYQEARVAIAQYRLAEARGLLEAARALLDEVAVEEAFELRIRIMVSEAWLLCDAVGLPAALVQLDDAIAQASTRGRDDLCAVAHTQAGVLRARAGESVPALRELAAAVELGTGLPLDDRVRVLLNKGTIASQAGLLDEAAADLRAAADLASQLPDYAFMALHNLGYVEYLRGDLPTALTIMGEADLMDSGVDRAVAGLDRARVVMEAGLIDDAAELLDVVVQQLEEGGLAAEAADARLDLARCALLRGDHALASALAISVAEAARERGEADKAMAADVVWLEAAVLGPRVPADAPGVARALATRATAAGRRWTAARAAALGGIASAVLGDGGSVEAGSWRLLKTSPYLAIRILGLLADLATTESRATRARLARQAAADLAGAQSGVASLDLRTAAAVHVVPIIEADLRRVVEQGRAWQALLATERWRWAEHALPSVGRPADPGVAELWSQLRQLHDEYRTAPAGRESELRRSARLVEEQLRAQGWRLPGSGVRVRPQRLRRAELESCSALSYFWVDDRLHVVILVPGRSARLVCMAHRDEMKELLARGIADAQALSRLPHGPLAASVVSSWTESWAQLDAVLLPEDLPPGDLVIVPSGALARLPWAMLPRLRGRAVRVARSLSASVRGETVLREPPRIAVASGPGLPMAGPECAAVVARWRVAELIKGETEPVKQALASHDVVHLVAHGRHRADSPLFSSLRLHDGELFAHELESVPVRASLVVLSACGVGRARVRPGEEALGLTASLLALGVRAVVAPLTDVPDEASFRAMAEFHVRLAAGEDGPAALAAATAGDPATRSFTWFGSSWRASPA